MFKTFYYIFHVLILGYASFALASEPHYAIIIDAGSTGSRLHLFQYEKTDRLPIIAELLFEESKPGLSSFANQAEEAGKSLKTLLDHANEKLAEKHIDPHSVSLQLLATAGMRLLPNEQATHIYAAVKDYLESNYAFEITEITTIAEKMEGVYGWLDVNYLLKNFDENAEHTNGILDMGGASTEITFATADTSKLADEVFLKVNGKNYVIFSKSFLGLGQDQARLAMNKNSNSRACYPLNFPMENNDKGSFNLASCQLFYKDVIANYRITEQLPVLQKTTFIAYSAFYYVGHFFDIEKTTDQASVEKRIQSVCSNPWDKLQQDYPQVPAKYIANYCANGAYIADLLYNTYQLQGGQIVIEDKINNKAIDWPLGALLYQLL